MPQKILFTSIKNEGPFLLEWVAYHRMIGFERVIVFSNDCTDGSWELLDALAEKNIIEHHRQEVIPGKRPQHQAAATAVEQGLFPMGDLVMWLDLDEFVVVNLGDHSIDTLVKKMGNANGISLNWRIFGDSDQRGLTDRFVSEAYSMASKRHDPRNRQVKSIFRISDDIARIDLHQPFWRPRPDGAIVVLNGAGAVMPDEYVRPRRMSQDPITRIKIQRGIYRYGQINHYMVRNRDLYALKKTRGRGNAEVNSTAIRHNNHYFNRYNLNIMPDRAILRHQAALDEAIAELLIDPKIAKCHQDCIDITQASLAALPASERL